MQLHTNIKNPFLGRAFLFCSILVFFCACNIAADTITNAIDVEGTSTQATTQSSVDGDEDDATANIKVSVVVEQDPHGIYWGLRDTITGELVADYVFHQIGTFRNGFAMCMQDGKFGLIAKTGKVVIEPSFDFYGRTVSCGYIIFDMGSGPTLIFDTIGKPFMPMMSGITGFLPCQNRMTVGYSRYGMMNLNGDTILPFTFLSARLFPEGFCATSIADEVRHTRLFGLYDLDGKQVLPHEYESIAAFYCGRAIVKKDGKYGIIDETGKVLVINEYGRIDRFYKDYALVYTSSKKGPIKIGVIDKSGREVVPAIYQWGDYACTFIEGMSAMSLNGKYGFLNTKGEVVIPFKYVRVESFEGGIAKVWLDWKYVGYINTKGEEVVPINFDPMDQANLRRYCDKFIIGLKDSVYHVFDYSGNKITTFQYELFNVFDYDQKSFVVYKNHKFGTLDSNFQVKIPFEYESLEIIFPNKIAARKKNKIGFINHEGQVLSPFEYDGIEPVEADYMDDYQNGLAKVSKKGKVGMINSYGNIIIPVKYDEIQKYAFGLVLVKRNNKYGFVNEKGKEVIPAIYDSASPFDGYSAEVVLKGKTFQIDHKGKLVEEDGC